MGILVRAYLRLALLTQRSVLLLNTEFDAIPMASPVVEKPVEFLCECELRIELAQEQKTRVTGDLTTVKIDNDFPLKTKRELIMTLCSHRSSVCCERLVW